MRKLRLFYILVISVAMVGCDDDYYLPKPPSYFRIDFPEKKYESLDDFSHFSFEKPVLSGLQMKSQDSSQFNLVYPQHKAKIHFTYVDMRGQDLNQLLDDAYNYAYKHNSKASAIEATPISMDSTQVYGLAYDLKGNVATHLQFFATDSTQNFLRGSLYFGHKPNADSIAPVLDYIKKDVNHICSTLRWK